MTDSQPTLGEAAAKRATEDSDNEPADTNETRVSFDAGFPSDVDAAAVQAAREVLRTAPSADRVYALVSGGHDSLTAMHIVYQSSLPLDGIIHIRTGIGIPETRNFVRERVDELGLEYHEVGAKHDEPGYHSEHRRVHEEYEELVKQFGFPGPGAHKWMYVNLKEKPLQRFLSDIDNEVLLVSGVSKHESDTRMENVDDDGIQTYLGRPTISPLVEFTGMDVRDYRRGLDLPMNPVVEKLEMSAECLCGAFASREELKMLKLFYPDTHYHIKCLEAAVGARTHLEDGPPKEYARWGHNRLEERERTVLDDDDQMLLCRDCEWQGECDQDDSNQSDSN